VSFIIKMLSGGASATNSAGGRYALEKEELKDSTESAVLSKEEMALEKEEQRDLEEIIHELSVILEQSRKLNGGEIRVGDVSTHVNRAIPVLINSLHQLIHARMSIRQEETNLVNIRNKWMITRNGVFQLTNRSKRGAIVLARVPIVKEIQKRANIIDKLFNQLGIDLKMEEKITQQKLQMIREEYKMAQSELGRR